MKARQQVKREPAVQYETDPARLKHMVELIETLDAAGDHGMLDAFDSEGPLRRLAEHLRVPYLYVQMLPFGIAGITDADVDEYNDWRAACGRKAGAR